MQNTVEIERATIRGVGDSNSPYVLLSKSIRWKLGEPVKGDAILFIQDAETNDLSICPETKADQIGKLKVVVDRTKIINMGSGSPYFLIPASARRKLEAEAGDEFLFLEDLKTRAIIVRVEKSNGNSDNDTASSQSSAKRAS